MLGVPPPRAAARGAGWPSSSSWPEVGFSSWANSRASVDLPEPLSPTIAVIRPAGSASETPSTA